MDSREIDGAYDMVSTRIGFMNESTRECGKGGVFFKTGENREGGGPSRGNFKSELL